MAERLGAGYQDIANAWHQLRRRLDKATSDYWSGNAPRLSQTQAASGNATAAQNQVQTRPAPDLQPRPTDLPSWRNRSVRFLRQPSSRPVDRSQVVDARKSFPSSATEQSPQSIAKRRSPSGDDQNKRRRVSSPSRLNPDVTLTVYQEGRRLLDPDDDEDVVCTGTRSISGPSNGSDDEDIPGDLKFISRAKSNATALRSRPATAMTRRSDPQLRRGRTEHSIPEFEHFVCANGRLEPIASLPRATQKSLLDALNALFHLDFKRACTITRRSNSGTYLNSGICLGRHLLSRNNKTLAPASLSCSTCCGFPGARPCVRLETSPTRTEPFLVFYPRPRLFQPANAVWTQPDFWLGYT